MLENDFKAYVEKDLAKYSALDLKTRNPYSYNEHSYRHVYSEFLKENIYTDKKYLDDLYNEYGLNYNNIGLTESTIQHIDEKSRINIKAVTKLDKIIQYSMYWYINSYTDKIDSYDLHNKIKDFSNDEQLDIWYNVTCACLDRGEDVSNKYNITYFYDTVFKNNKEKELKHDTDIKTIFLSIVNNKRLTADTTMKQKLVNLMEKANITNYELNQLDYTQITPDYNSYWYGGDWGGMEYNFNDKLNTKKKDYGWVVVVKDLGWNISTDGKNFYLSKLSGPSTVEFSQSEIKNYLYGDRDKNNYEDRYKPTLVLTEEKIIEYLSSNTKYEPTDGFIKVSISKFDPYFKEGEYYGYGRLAAPDTGEKFQHAINHIAVDPSDIEDCESIELVPEYEKVFYIKFKFLTKKSRQDVIEECEHYAYNLINDNYAVLSHYTKAYRLSEAIKCNHFKIGAP